MIHSIRINNFKSIKDVSVDLSPVTVFVGRSGTGKSNFLEAIVTLKRLVAGNLSVHGHNWPSHFGEKGQRFLFECRFSVTGINKSFSYFLSNNKHTGHGGNVWGIEEKLALGDETLYHHSTGKQNVSRWIHPPDVMNVPKPKGILLGKLPALSEAVIAFTAITSGLGLYDFSDTVLTVGNANSGGGLLPDATNYLNVLKLISEDLRDVGLKKRLVATLRRVNPTIASVELDNLQSPRSVVVAHRFHQDAKLEQLTLGQESAGVRRFYAHLLALYQQPPKQTLMFEHPEDGIHPGAMSLLAEEFKDAPDEGRGQVLITTHNPMLLDNFSAEQIRVVDLDNSETVIGPIEESQQEAIRQDLLDAGELLTTDPARIQKVDQQ